jgi:ABC-2 type transport system permease protein
MREGLAAGTDEAPENAASSRPPLTTGRTVALVAQREFTTRVRTKAFLWSNAIVLTLIAVAIVVVSVLSGGPSGPSTVGFVGDAQRLDDAVIATASTLDVDVETQVIADEQVARDQVSEGELDVAVLASGPTSYVAVTDSALDAELQSVLGASVEQAALDAALEAQDVDRAALDQAVAEAGLQVEAIDPPDPERTERGIIAYLAVVLLFFQIFVFGLYVATGVVEEKTSRIVELLLSTIRPMHLLAGKVLGIGAVGLAQLTAYGVVGVVAGLATGLVTVTGTVVAVFLTTLAWFVLGFVFFGVLYAAAGSLVSRQEDVNSTTTPINVLAFAVFFSAQYALSDPDGTLATVLSWVPPFSAALMPLRVATGDAGLAQVVGSAAIMLVATGFLVIIGARIYERSVLRSGTTVNVLDVLRGRA